MIMVVERRTPVAGYVLVCAAHFWLAVLYGLGAAESLFFLVKALRDSGLDDSVSETSILAAILSAWAVFHLVTGIGARRKRAWARQASRVVAFLLFLLVPVGTGIAMYLLRHTSPDRWTAAPAPVGAPPA